PVIVASCSKRRMREASLPVTGSITLRARRRFVTSSLTSYTAPAPPDLMGRTTRYRPWKREPGLSMRDAPLGLVQSCAMEGPVLSSRAAAGARVRVEILREEAQRREGRRRRHLDEAAISLAAREGGDLLDLRCVIARLARGDLLKDGGDGGC